jgi:hypothetical protein
MCPTTRGSIPAHVAARSYRQWCIQIQRPLCYTMKVQEADEAPFATSFVDTPRSLNSITRKKWDLWRFPSRQRAPLANAAREAKVRLCFRLM